MKGGGYEPRHYIIYMCRGGPCALIIVLSPLEGESESEGDLRLHGAW